MNNSTSFITTVEWEDLKRNIDDFYIMTNGIFISLMQCGFACLEVGAVRTKNAANILMKNLLDIVICCFSYYMFGYAFAYGNGNAFIGYTYWAGVGLPLTSFVDWYFQFIFSATAATIVSGAVAERCHFVAYLIYSAVISGFVYPVVTHWAWSKQGWLNAMGFTDFSGTGVVHALSGTCAFVAAKLLGPRKGRFDENGKPKEMNGHSLAISGIGALLLISGFFAFNGGALGHITKKGDSIIVARSMINTVIAGCGAGLLSLILGRLRYLSDAPWPFTLILNGTLSGMASSCAAPHTYAAWAAFIIGIGGAVSYFCLHRLILYLQVDDPLDATALHFGGGCWGTIAQPIFDPSGILFQANYHSGMGMLANTVGLIAIILWAGTLSLLLFGTLKYFGILRVSEHEELEGLDVHEHGEEAYPRTAWGDGGFGWTVNVGPSLFKPQISLGEPTPVKKSAQGSQGFPADPHYVWSL